MMDYREAIRETAAKLSALSLIDPKDIPRIELYMEQLTTFFEEEMGDVRRHSDEKILTKTMINNYTKNGILDPPARKKYNRDHIIALVYIFLLKPVLAIQDIRQIFDMQPDGHTSEEQAALYTVFTRMLDDYREKSADRIKALLASADRMLAEAGLDDPRYSVMLLCLLLSVEATAGKLTVGRLVDRFRDWDWDHTEKESR
jgi:DNA-binding transcriptional MerR regulator